MFTKRLPILSESFLREAILIHKRSISSIAKEVGYDPRTVSSQVDKYQIPRSRRQREQTKHNGNVEAFKKVEHYEIAYILGFLWADGHIKNTAVRICIIEKDGEYIASILNKHCLPRIYKIKAKNINNRKNKAQLSININDKALAQYLISLGYKEKSKIAPTKVLKTIPEQYKSMFWLGYHDGDGCLDTKKYRCSYSSTFSQDWTELEQLLVKLNIKYSIRYYKNPTKPHSFSSLTIESIRRTHTWISYLYSHKLMGLPRKIEQYQAFLQIPVPKPYIPPSDPVIIARRERQNLLRRMRLRAARQKVEQSIVL